MFRWHKAFKEEREDIKDEQCIGSPSTFYTLDNVAKEKAVLNCNLTSVGLIADKVELKKSNMHEIIMTELKVEKIYNQGSSKTYNQGKEEKLCVHFP